MTDQPAHSTPATLTEVEALLTDAATQAAESAARECPGQLTSGDDDLVSRSQAERLFELILHSLDEMLGANLHSNHDVLSDILCYGPGDSPLGTELKQFARSVRYSLRHRTPVLFIGSDGCYDALSGRIWVASERQPLPRFLRLLASEATHAYQDRLSTSTTQSVAHLEGFECAVSLRLLAHFSGEDSLSSPNPLDTQQRHRVREKYLLIRAKTLIAGVIALRQALNQSVTAADLLDLEDIHSSTLLDIYPESSWDVLPEYHFIGPVLFLSGLHGVEYPYRRFFQPSKSHPWSGVFDQLSDNVQQPWTDPTVPFREESATHR